MKDLSWGETHTKEVEFTLVKEARDYIRIRLDNSKEKVCVNVSKSKVSYFDKKCRTAYFNEDYINWLFKREMEKIIDKRIKEKMAYEKQLKEEYEKELTKKGILNYE